MLSSTRVILIGGTSHIGKSTLAQSLAETLNWQYLSTDSLSRHPGRPWRTDGTMPPKHVIQYFQNESVEVLLTEVLHHFQHNVWPIAKALIHCRLANDYDSSLVLEGSAILPDCVNDQHWNGVKSFWLLGSDTLIEQRIRQNSQYSTQPADTQKAITGFLNRSLAFNNFLSESATRFDLETVNAEDSEQLAHIKQSLIGDIKNAQIT